MISNDEAEHLDHCKTYCNCGTPDPLNEGHAASCPMMLPVGTLREVEETTGTPAFFISLELDPTKVRQRIMRSMKSGRQGPA